MPVHAGRCSFRGHGSQPGACGAARGAVLLPVSCGFLWASRCACFSKKRCCSAPRAYARCRATGQTNRCIARSWPQDICTLRGHLLEFCIVSQSRLLPLCRSPHPSYPVIMPPEAILVPHSPPIDPWSPEDICGLFKSPLDDFIMSSSLLLPVPLRTPLLLSRGLPRS